jgi:hypothetical protein
MSIEILENKKACLVLSDDTRVEIEYDYNVLVIPSQVLIDGEKVSLKLSSLSTNSTNTQQFPKKIIFSEGLEIK